MALVDEVRALVAANPLALVVSTGRGDALSTPLPLVLDKSHKVLHGHFGAGNPHVSLLRSKPRALAIFQGPSSYVSPSWLADRSRAPTFFYSFVEFTVEVEFVDGADERRASLEHLVDHLEQGHEGAWSLDELGETYEKLASGIRPFRAYILCMRTMFKLGQQDRVDVVEDALVGLESAGCHQLAALVEAELALRKAVA